MILALAGDDSGAITLGIFIFAMYFLPALVAWNKRNFGAILVLDILLGWTVIGWIVALVWAFTNDVKSLPSETSLMICPSCGKYSQPGSKFCSQCGMQWAAR